MKSLLITLAVAFVTCFLTPAMMAQPQPILIDTFYSNDPPVRLNGESREDFAGRIAKYNEAQRFFAEAPERNFGETESTFAARREEFRKSLPDGVELMPDHVIKSLSPKVYEGPKIQFFYEMMPSFANILADETNARGDGWEITTAGRRLINLAIEELQLERDKSIKEGRRELTKSETIALWKRVFKYERESEEKLSDILDQVFSPLEFDRFVQQHKKIEAIVISSKICCDRLHVSKKDYEWMQDCKVEWQKISMNSLEKFAKNGEPRVKTSISDMKRLLHKQYGRLNPGQFLESQRILGAANTNESLTDFLNRIPIENYQLFMNSVPSLAPLNTRR